MKASFTLTISASVGQSGGATDVITARLRNDRHFGIFVAPPRLLIFVGMNFLLLHMKRPVASKRKWRRRRIDGGAGAGHLC